MVFERLKGAMPLTDVGGEVPFLEFVEPPVETDDTIGLGVAL